MLENYLPILIFLIVGILVGAGPLVLGYLLGPRRPDPEKDSPYETLSKAMYECELL